MNNTMTREAMTALVDAHYEARADDWDGIVELEDVAGTGTPASEAFAQQLGADYICALEDGTIAAWGAEIVRDGYTDRELVFIAPADQTIDADAE